MEADVIIISDEEAQDLFARERDHSVRVTPLKTEDGRWYLAPNVVREMDAGKTYARLDDHLVEKTRPAVRARLRADAAGAPPLELPGNRV